MEWVKDAGGGHTPPGDSPTLTPWERTSPTSRLLVPPLTGRVPGPHCPQTPLPQAPGLLSFLRVERVSGQVSVPGLQPGLLQLTCVCDLGDLFHL